MCVCVDVCVYACVCVPVDDARPRMTHLSNETCAVRSGAAKRSSAAATMRAELSPTSATRRAPSRAPKLRRAHAHTRTHARTHACTRAERFVERRIEGRARARACQQLEGHHARVLLRLHAPTHTHKHVRACARRDSARAAPAPSAYGSARRRSAECAVLRSGAPPPPALRRATDYRRTEIWPVKRQRRAHGIERVAVRAARTRTLRPVSAAQLQGCLCMAHTHMHTHTQHAHSNAHTRGRACTLIKTRA